MQNSLKQHRQARGMTQEELAKRLHVTRQTVIAIETGKYSPSIEVALGCARVLGVRVEQLFSLE